MPQDDNKLGTALIVGSAVAYSLSGYFTRLIELDVWTILFWRGIFGGAFIGVFIAWRRWGDLRGALRGMGLPGAFVTLLSALATICFIGALRLAPVADVMTIHAAIPFMTAAIAFLFTGEREDWVTWGASLTALVGVAVILNPQGGDAPPIGGILATVMALSYAAMMVIIRRNQQVSMLPAAGLSALLCALIALPLADPAAVGGADLLELFLFGTLQFGMGLLLMMLGTRLISATRSALIGSLENPLAPLWVWLAFAERPTPATWIGGAIVMTAVIGDIALKARRARLPALTAE